MSFIYAVSKCANEIEEFIYRFIDGKVVLFDKINTSLTYLNKETELFKVIRIEMQDSLKEFVFAALEKAQNQQEYFTSPLDEDIFQFSPFPWVSYTHISHTDSGKKDNAIPIFDWGKFYEKDEKIVLPFFVQVHHSFVDGIHIGKLAKSLQDYLTDF